jgi:hypothetical protein
MGYIWIHPPVNCWSKSEEIRAWLDDLQSRPQDPQREEAIAEAEQWLEFALEFEAELNKQAGA